MKLSAQLQAEIKTIQARCDQMKMEYNTYYRDVSRKCRITSEIKEISRTIIEKLNPDKVRMENILCETDIKEQGHLLHSLWTVHRV